MAALGAGSGHAEAAGGSEALRECIQIVVKDSEVLMMEQEGGPGHVVTHTVSEEVIRTIAESNPVYYLQADGSLVPEEELAGPALSWPQGDSPAGHVLVSVAPEPPLVLKDAAQQLRAVAQHVALLQGGASPVTQKNPKSIRVEVPGLQPKKNKIQVVGPLQLMQKSEGNDKMNTGPPSLLGAQIIHMKPQSEHEQEQLFLQTSDAASPVQLVQKSLPASAKSKYDGSKTKALIPGETASEQSVWTTQRQHGLVATSTPRATKKSSEKGHRGKKPLKVKTRSGRISRPPKHKVKDYKFIKVGDLALSHNSDSDDYLELNSEDDEDLARDNTSRDLQSNPMKHSLFQCESCEKSYMGKGGLSRHYRLHPAHGQLQSSSDGTLKVVEACGSSGAPQPLPSEQQAAASEAEETLSKDPQKDLDTSSAPVLDTIKRETKSHPRGRNGSRQPKSIGRSVGRFRRSRKILRTDSPEQDALNKLKLKELLQQCENTDLKELLLPYVTNLFTVFEFLLLKVEYDHPKNPHFPSVYKEFEHLHFDIKAMAQDYFANVDQAVEKTVDIQDHKVAESLEIFFEDSAVGSMSPTSNKQASSDIMHSEEELQPPPAKRQKTDTTVSDCDGQTSPNEATSITPEEKQNHSNQGMEHHLPEDGSYLMTTSNNSIVLITQTIAHSEQTENFAEVLFESGSDQSHYQVAGVSEVAEGQPCTELSVSSSNSDRDAEEPMAVACNFDGHFALENLKMATICQEEASGMLFPCQTQPSVFQQASSEHMQPELSYPGAGQSNVVESHSTDLGDEPEKDFAANVSSDHTYMTYTDTLEIPQGTTVLLETSMDGNCVIENNHQATLCDVNRDQFVIIQNVEEMAAAGAGALLVKNDATALHLESVETYFQMETK